jgi:RNA polymerase sigma-70 factor (ECF subfamily)
MRRATMHAPATQPSSRRDIDAGLIHRSLAGDRAAARALHRHYLPVATAFLRKLGTRPDEMEDAGQEVFLQFFRHLPGFRGEAELKTWLYRLCMTEARRVRRRRKIGAALAAVLRNEPPRDAVAPALRSAATIHALVKHALDRMEPEQRLAFILFEVQGFTGKEVAEIAGRSLPSTFRRLYGAQRVLRETLS